MPKDRRQKRDLHALDDEGMVLCNPRDKEAAHRAQVEGITTEDRGAVTCRKCRSLLPKLGKAAGSMPAVPKYTPRQGEYLAFIYHYTKRHHRRPAERDLQEYFRLLQPAVHDMLRRLKQRGFISWEPGVPRSIRLLLKREELPDLE
jgi:DNA-binding MarR family transcriptional regulator